MLHLALSQDPQGVVAPAPGEGATVQYEVVLTNLGPDIATGVEVTDLLPAGVTFAASQTSQFHSFASDLRAPMISTSRFSKSGQPESSMTAGLNSARFLRNPNVSSSFVSVKSSEFGKL